METTPSKIPFYLLCFFTNAIIVGAVISACTNPIKSPSITANQTLAPENKGESADASFLITAAQINLEEIQLGQLAQSRGTKLSVKNFGKMMEKEHTDMLTKLQTVAASKNMVLPSVPSDEMLLSIKNLTDSGATEFDKEYCSRMVIGHKAAIDKYDNASKNANDPDVRAYATVSLLELKKHLELALDCQKKL